MARSEKIIGLDIGYTKLAALLAEIDQYDKINVLGCYTIPAEGFEGGVVIDLQKAMNTVSECLTGLKNKSGLESLDKCAVFVGINGNHIQYLTSISAISVKNPQKGITENDIKTVLSQAQTLRLPADSQIIHVFAKQFIIDGQKGIKNPLGMFGNHLEIEAIIIIGMRTIIENILRIFKLLKLPCNALVLQNHALANIVTNEKERNLGIGIIDIGGKTTITVYKDNVLAYYKVLPIGGINVTNDIAICLKLPPTVAEDIKIKYGVAHLSCLTNNDTINICDADGNFIRNLQRRTLTMIIESRIEEILEQAEQDLRNAGFSENLPCGIVITGNTSRFKGIDALANKVFNLPVKIATMPISCEDPNFDSSYLTALGIINFAISGDDLYLPKSEGLFSSLVNKIREMFL
ncbi:MAG: cell division protein FtsA [candidate division WOR-3 bacterium]|nr:cell division protein FtsA [candidate division WOR-3 bacterium]